MSTAPPISPLAVHLNLGPRSYDVLIGSVVNNAGAHIRAVLPAVKAAALVFDPALPANYIEAITSSLHAHGFKACRISPSTTQRRWESAESNKRLWAVESILTQLAEKNLSRTDPIISLGGGILSDLAGFAATIYRRGVPWINIPTTLLSMVDASVGGKTGANLHTESTLQKNMVGAFHQPKLVLIDPAFLLTLPKRELAAGFAECIKHAMIAGTGTGTPSLRDGSIPTNGQTPITSTTSESHCNQLQPSPTQPKPSLSFESVATALAALNSLSPTNLQAFQTLSVFIHANISLKARIVEQDEFETSTQSTNRMLLNLGHTFAHAIESVSSTITNPLNPTSPINHGEAVALGLVAASSAAAAMNLIPQSNISTLKSLLQQVPLPTSIQALPDNARMIQLMHADKKTLGTTLRVILPTSDSTAAVFTNPTSALEAGWNAIRA